MVMVMVMVMGNMLLWKHVNIGLLDCFPISAISNSVKWSQSDGTDFG